MKSYMVLMFFFLVAGCNGSIDRNNKTVSAQAGVIVVMALNVKGGVQYTHFKETLSIPLDQYSGKIIREFQVLGKANRSIKFGSVNRVVVLKFPTKEESNNYFQSPVIKEILRSANHSNLKILIGAMLASLSARDGELYILKISNYKSDDGQAQQVAEKINQVLRRKYGFHPDFSIKITSAKNIGRVDEVAVFFYTKATNQKQLYKDKEAMKQIGDLNRKYLDNFVYLVLKPLGK